MRRYSRLDRFGDSAERRLARLRRRAVAARTNRPHLRPGEFEAEISYLTLMTANLWSTSAKWYFISCAMGATLKGGMKVASPLPINDPNDALGVAIRLFRPTAAPSGATGLWDRRDEPSWHEPNTLMKVITHAQLPHNTTVSQSFALSAKVFSDLPVFRNYFAHKNRETREAAQRIARPYGVNTLQKPSLILCEKQVGSGSSILEEWIDELTATVALLCG